MARKMKSKGKGKAKGGRRRVFKAVRDVPDMASLSTNDPIIDPGTSNSLLSGVFYNTMNVSLDQFDRAVNVAKSYQHYRIKKISIKLKPLFDTFNASLSGNGVPYLYYMIDKSGSLPTNPTIDILRNAGAKPIRFDEREIVISYRPAVLMGVRDNNNVDGDATSSYKISPWLSTNNAPVSPGVWNPSSVDHNGCYWSVQAFSTPQLFYQADLMVEFEFKKPLYVEPVDATAVAAPESVSFEVCRSAYLSKKLERQVTIG